MFLTVISIVKGLLCAWLFTCLILFNPTKIMKIHLKIFLLLFSLKLREEVTDPEILS